MNETIEGSPEAKLWRAVIYQALCDATLGISDGIIYGEAKDEDENRIFQKKVTPYAGLTEIDVWKGRRFISGQSESLKHICGRIGLDYSYTRKKLVDFLNRCTPYMDEKNREVLK